ncbi:MAG: hypothetical protein ACKVP3_26205 [Hyphomicrobiaceae bacterium]
MHQDLQGLVEAESGDLAFKAFVWDGLNSEASRWRAGKELLKVIQPHDAAGKPYCIVGHSHGGSVIAHSLIAALALRNALPRLSAWLAVGTPFIEVKARKWLFSRISIWGKSAYLLTLCFLFWGAAMLFHYFRSLNDLMFAIQDPVFYQTLVVSLIPLAVAIATLKWMEADKIRALRRLRPGNKPNGPLDKLILFHHETDEAIAGLGAVRSIKFAPFAANFAVPFFAFLAIFVPVALFLLVLADAGASVRVANTIRNFVGSSSLDEFELERFQDPVLRVIEFSLHLVVAPSVLVLNYLSIPPFKEYTATTSALAALLLIGGIFFWWLVVNLFVSVVTIISTGASYVLSAFLNRLAKSQIATSALGGDALGELTIAAHALPPWCKQGFNPLPPELADELSAASDLAATAAFRRVRRNLSRLVYSDRQETSDALVEYLTWKELIHTTYFDSPAFRKLLAFAIAQSAGFRASEKFLADPDYRRVEKWFRDITAERSAKVLSPAPAMANGP